MEMTPQAQSESAMDDILHYRFRLYVAGDGTNSVQASENLAALCRNYLVDRCVVEIVDVFQEPMRALADEVFMTPTLLKLGPAPVRRIVGTLSVLSTLLTALNLGEVPHVT